MKNKLFLRCMCLCILAGFLVNLRSVVMLFNEAAAGMIPDRGFGSSLMSMGNKIQSSLVPGLAAGFAGLMMSRKLRLWQGCLLCLSLPFFDVLFQCVLIPLLSILFAPGSYSITLSAVIFNYTVTQSYSFQVFFIALIFYGILEKNRLVVLTSAVWNMGWYVLLYLIPPFFPRFDYNQMRMDQGELTRRWMLYGLSYLAVVLLLVFVFCDIKKQKRE